MRKVENSSFIVSESLSRLVWIQRIFCNAKDDIIEKLKLFIAEIMTNDIAKKLKKTFGSKRSAFQNHLSCYFSSINISL